MNWILFFLLGLSNYLFGYYCGWRSAKRHYTRIIRFVALKLASQPPVWTPARGIHRRTELQKEAQAILERHQ